MRSLCPCYSISSSFIIVACNDESNRSAPTKKRFDDLLQLSLPKKCPLHGLNLAQQATIVRGEPPVQLVVHNSADTSQFFGKQGPRNSKHRLEDDKNCVKYLEIELGEGTPLVNELRNQLRQRHFDRVHSPVVSGKGRSTTKSIFTSDVCTIDRMLVFAYDRAAWSTLFATMRHAQPQPM